MLHEKALAEDVQVVERSLDGPAKWLCLECIVKFAGFAIELFQETPLFFLILCNAHFGFT